MNLSFLSVGKKILHFKDSLVGAAAEAELLVTLGLDERAVYEDVYVTQEGHAVRVVFLQKFFNGETGVAPDCFCGLFFYS